MEKVKMVRVQLDVPEERIKQIEALMKEMGHATRKDFYEEAVDLLFTASTDASAGRLVGAWRNDKIFREYVLKGLSALQRHAKANLR